MKRISLFLSILILTSTTVHAQDTQPKWIQKLDQYKIKATLGLQLWGTYTNGEEIYNETDGKYTPAEDRLNFQIRRTRMGLSGQPFDNLQFKLTAALDLVGRDLLAGTEAGANNGASPQFRLWDAYVQWRVLNNKEALNVVAGYIVPQFGRESMTSSMRSTSFEKSISQFYLRRHLTGTNPGRSVGLNVGGLLVNADHTLNWSYDMAIFNAFTSNYDGNSTGIQYSPLLTGRIAMHIGDPEQNTYSLSRKVNYLNKRKGLTVGLAGARQGETDLFTSNTAAGVDVLFNWGRLNIDGDWTYLWRAGMEGDIGAAREFKATSQTGYIRVSYNLNVTDRYIIEPLVMYARYIGEEDAEGQDDAALVGTTSGMEELLDIGVNFYFNPDLRLAFHYSVKSGDAGAAGDGAMVNSYFAQSGVGPIHRGDWLGLGLIAVF